MKILLDTNIIIYREDDVIIQERLSLLFQTLNEMSSSIYLHRGTEDDIKRDQDIDRQQVISSKIKAYSFLPSPPDPFCDEKYLNIIGPIRNENDKIDIKILYSLFRNAADYLITEDMGLHRRALKLGISDRVLTINDSLEFFRESIHVKPISGLPPSLKEKYLHEIPVEDPIFDTLRWDYSGFDDWYNKKAREHRKCLAYIMDNNRIGAILIFKSGEIESIEGDNPQPQKKRFKIATMKVTYVGQKIGELLLKKSFDIAINDGCEEVYLTHFDEKNDRLVALIEEYGFEHISTKKDGEKIYIKKLFFDESEKGKLSPIEIMKRFYPSFYDGVDVQKWIIPIKKEYHQRLFTDYPDRQTSWKEFSGEFIVEGNTIKKAYICRAKVQKMAPGDIVLFYRSQDLHTVTSLGVVEDVFTNISNSADVLRLVGKRTVYSPEEIEQWDKPVLVIIFRHHFHFQKPVSLSEMNMSHPQSISRLENDEYQAIKTLGGLNERFTVN